MNLLLIIIIGLWFLTGALAGWKYDRWRIHYKFLVLGPFAWTQRGRRIISRRCF